MPAILDAVTGFAPRMLRADGLRRKLRAAMAQADRDEAMRLAERGASSPRSGDWFALRLAEMKLDMGDAAFVRKLHGERPTAFATADGKALHARLLMLEGDNAKAERVLLDLLTRERTPDALRLLRLLPVDAAMLDRACAAFQRSPRGAYRKATQSAHLVELATLAGDLDRGMDIAARSLAWLEGATPEQAAKSDRDLGPDLDKALADFHALMRDAGDFFLISGTLLGVMRDKRLIGSDKDIDVGVFDDAVIARAENLAATSFAFSRDVSPHISGVKLKHRNGVVVDVFLHHVEGDTVWHGGPAHVWDNSRWWAGDGDRFATLSYRGSDYLIPTAWEAYLTENYGDWRTPVSGFTASIDAPNVRLADRRLAKLQRRVDFVKYYHRADFGRLLGAMTAYETDFGADEYLAEARRVMFAGAGFPAGSRASGQTQVLLAK